MDLLSVTGQYGGKKWHFIPLRHLYLEVLSHIGHGLQSTEVNGKPQQGISGGGCGDMLIMHREAAANIQT